LPELKRVECGLLHLFIQHTSASLAVNENADPSVRTDLEAHFNHFVPERAPYYRHLQEGPDDMPAHIKSALTATQLAIPFQDGQLLLGTWQGIYLWEHRYSAGERTVILHIQEDT